MSDVVAEDLTPKDFTKRLELKDVIANARKNGMKTRFSKGQLYIDGRRYDGDESSNG